MIIRSNREGIRVIRFHRPLDPKKCSAQITMNHHERAIILGYRRPINIAVWALVEVGRPDLAALVRLGKHPWIPTLEPSKYNWERDHVIVARAFYLAHLTAHPGAIWTGEGTDCPTCEREREERDRNG